MRKIALTPVEPKPLTIEVTIKAILTLPEGTQVPEEGRGFTLPNGDWVKPFVVMEINDDRDLTFAEAEGLGVSVDEVEIEWFEV